jgi:hypothetical protein
MGHAIYDPGQEDRPAWNVGRKARCQAAFLAQAGMGCTLLSGAGAPPP